MLIITRAELYDLLWEMPVKKIAAFYAVNPIQLANTCDEYDIPRPPPGYWQKLHYGKPVEQSALSIRNFPLEEIVIVPSQYLTRHRRDAAKPL